MYRTSLFAVVLLFVTLIPPAEAAQGERSVADLVAELKKGEKNKLEAIEQLEALGAKAADAVPALIELLKLKNEDVRLRATMAMGKIGKPAVGPLIKACASTDTDVRFYASWGLALVGPQAREATPALLKALGDPLPQVRRKAVFALGRIDPDPKAVVNPLVAALGDVDADVREAAAEALPKFGKHAVPVLIKTLDDNKARPLAMRVLGAIGPEAEAAIPELNRLMLDSKEQAAAAQALGSIGAASIKVLNAAAADDDPEMRVLAVQALFRTGAAGVPALIDLLGSKHDNVRRRVAALLGNVQTKDKSVITALGVAARDKDANVRVAALGSIGIYGPGATAVESQVVALLIDDQQNVRVTAFLTLKAIGVDPVPAFKKGLEHADAATRIRNAFAMFENTIELEFAESALKQGLKEKDVKVKLMSAHALAMRRMHVDDALPILIERLKHGDVGDRQDACQAISYYGGLAKKAGPALIAALDDTDEIVVDTALRTLRATVDDPKMVLSAMLKLLRADNATWHPQASQYLFEYGPNAIDEVIAILQTEKAPGVRLACLQTLAMIGPPAKNAMGELTKALEDASPHARLSAVRALGNIGPGAKPALDALTKAEKDTDVSVKQMATAALAQSKTKPDPMEFVVHGALTPGDAPDRVHTTSCHVVHYYPMKAGTKHRIELTSKWVNILRLENMQGLALTKEAEAAAITFVAPADGWYRIVVTSLFPQTSGPYSLRIKNVE